MRIAIISTLLLLVGASSTSTSECKTLCKDSRQQLLGDNATCTPALKHASGGNQKSFQLCVEGRKKVCVVFVSIYLYLSYLPVRDHD